MTLGVRRYPDKFGFLRLPDGGYGQDMSGRWWCRPPSGNKILLPLNIVIVNQDETITVTTKIYSDENVLSLFQGWWVH